MAQKEYMDSVNKIVKSLSGEEKIDVVLSIPFDKLNRNIKQSIVLANESLEEAKKIKDRKRIAETLRLLSIAYYYNGNYDLSTNSALESIKNYEELNDFSKAGDLYAIQGYQMKRRDLKKAFQYMKTGINYLEESKDSNSLSGAYNNLGVLYEMNNDYDSAFIFYSKGLEIVESLKDSIGLPYSYNNLSILFLLKNDFSKSKKYLDLAFEIRKNRNDLNGMAENYQFYGDLYAKQQQYNKAIGYYQKAFLIGKEINYPYMCQLTQEELAKNYSKLGDFKNAFESQKSANQYKEEILNQETNKAIAELEVQFDTEKTEKELIQKDLDYQQEKLKAERRNFGLLILAILISIILIITFIIYRQQKYKQRELIAKNELQEQISQEKLKNELNEERIRISRDLHDNIGSQLTFITSSVENIKYLNSNDKITPRLSQISDFTKDTISQLRDTIWAMNKDSISINDLHKRVANFINQAQNSAPNIQFKLEIDAENEKNQFSAAEGINIYRIMQEAVNNAIKYANSTQISLLLKNCKNENCITISDNGSGFDKQEVLLGNGLKNMENRAKEINAQIKITSKINEGTIIKIIV